MAGNISLRTINGTPSFAFPQARNSSIFGAPVKEFAYFSLLARSCRILFLEADILRSFAIETKFQNGGGIRNDLELEVMIDVSTALYFKSYQTSRRLKYLLLSCQISRVACYH